MPNQVNNRRIFSKQSECFRKSCEMFEFFAGMANPLRKFFFIDFVYITPRSLATVLIGKIGAECISFPFGLSSRRCKRDNQSWTLLQWRYFFSSHTSLFVLPPSKYLVLQCVSVLKKLLNTAPQVVSPAHLMQQVASTLAAGCCNARDTWRKHEFNLSMYLTPKVPVNHEPSG